eukprot:1185879-Prorocentrum_minimum.AAC.2
MKCGRGLEIADNKLKCLTNGPNELGRAERVSSIGVAVPRNHVSQTPDTPGTCGKAKTRRCQQVIGIFQGHENRKRASHDRRWDFHRPTTADALASRDEIFSTTRPFRALLLTGWRVGIEIAGDLPGSVPRNPLRPGGGVQAGAAARREPAAAGGLGRAPHLQRLQGRGVRGDGAAHLAAQHAHRARAREARGAAPHPRGAPPSPLPQVPQEQTLEHRSRRREAHLSRSRSSARATVRWSMTGVVRLSARASGPTAISEGWGLTVCK